MVPLTSKNQSFFESVPLVPKIVFQKKHVHERANKHRRGDHAEASIQVDDRRLGEEYESFGGELRTLGGRGEELSSGRSSLDSKAGSPLKRWLKQGRALPGEDESIHLTCLLYTSDAADE